MKRRYFLSLLIAFGLTSCADNSSTEANSSSGEELAAQLRQAELPENTPEVGTSVEDIIKPKADTAEAEVVDELKSAVNEILWKDLVPKEYEPKSILAKYQDQIDSIAEGTPEERALMKKMMAEFNNAPSNAELNGKRVKIPGFVSPLDQSNGTVGEFLLVPYFGSCIHSPPPPVNQTILVKPAEGKSIPLDQIYDPVWVTGYIKTEATTTSLAQAGYLIEDAQLEKYTEENTE
ncbi:MAG: DUF3299 domain-containing protein [Thiolinea sp.]